MIQNILFLCRAAGATLSQLRRVDHAAPETSPGEPARESLCEHFGLERRAAAGSARDSLRYLRLESCDH